MNTGNGLFGTLFCAALALLAGAAAVVTGCNHGIEPPLDEWLSTDDDHQHASADEDKDSNSAEQPEGTADDHTDTGQSTDTPDEPRLTASDESSDEPSSSDAEPDSETVDSQSGTNETPTDTGEDSSVGTGSETTQQSSDEEPAPPCLIISEYVEGSAKNKGVELLNCGETSLALEGYNLCAVFNDETECGKTLLLKGVLEPWDVLTVCYSGIDAAYKGLCDFTHALAYFNGDDRLVLSGPSGVLDAFGEIALPPEGTPWKDATYRRCDLEPFSGSGSFDLARRYSAHGIDDFSDFGLPPSESVACAAASK